MPYTADGDWKKPGWSGYNRNGEDTYQTDIPGFFEEAEELRELVEVMQTEIEADERLRDAYPGLKELWEKYTAMKKLRVSGMIQEAKNDKSHNSR
jgi:hypothetical protein